MKQLLKEYCQSLCLVKERASALRRCYAQKEFPGQPSNIQQRIQTLEDEGRELRAVIALLKHYCREGEI